MSEQSEYYNKKYHEKFKEVSEQIEQLKQENEELKQGQIHFENKWAQAEDKLEKIKGIVTGACSNTCDYKWCKNSVENDNCEYYRILKIIESKE